MLWTASHSGNGVNRARAERGGSASLSNDDDEFERWCAEVAWLRMERDVVKRSVVGWVTLTCAVLGVSVVWFSTWLGRALVA